MKIDCSSAGKEADLEGKKKEILEKSVINTKSAGRHAALQAQEPIPRHSVPYIK
jgi:hypothetical protein